MPLINNYTHYTNRGIVYIYTKQVPTYITTSKTSKRKISPPTNQNVEEINIARK